MSNATGAGGGGDDETVREQHDRPGLVDVYTSKGGLRRGDGTLHRLDDDHRCGSAPDYPGTSTDLITAAVVDDHDLCGHCNWPDGAEEVLHGDE